MRAWLLVVAGCYAPSPPAGLPCADNGACPSGQTCVAGVCGGGAPGTDATSTSDCWDKWKSGAATLTTPTVAYASPDDDTNPSLAPDALALYVTRDGDFYRAPRSNPTDAFGDAFVIDDLSSSADEDKLTIGGNGLVAVLSSNRTPLFGDYDLWIATRSAVGAAFPAPTRLPTSIDSPDSQFDPWLSSDGLTLYWAELNTLVPNGKSKVKKATRASASAQFDEGSVILDAKQPFNPVLSPDELVMIYTDQGGISIATRSSTNAGFHNGDLVPGLPGDADNPELSRDGCELVYNAPGGSSQDIFHAFVMP